MPTYSLAEGTKGRVCPLFKNEPVGAAVYEDYATEFNSIQSKCRAKQKTIILFQEIEPSKTGFFVPFLIYE